ARLNENDVPNAPLLRRTQLLDNEQIIASDSIARTRYEGFGEVRQARPAARFSRTPSAIGARAPKLGEHSTDILEGLGYSEDERRQLVEKEVIVTGENA
ncbi:MAG: CoA transferase, partial [Gammaproteobacteria bacterium]|nr:CoA transferase [Gammaproteobacteria bacterium]